MNKPIKHILVVDDDQRIRELLLRYLIDNRYYVTAAKSADEARLHMKNFIFDLLVIDIMMPGEDGLSLTKTIRKNTDQPILLLTARGEPEDRIAGLELGADDYLAKPFEPRELLLRIESIMRRKQNPIGLIPKTLLIGNVQFDFKRGELSKNGSLIKITSTELSLLRILAEKPEKTISRYDLCDAAGVNERSIDVQVTRLRKKIEPDPKSPRYLQTVWGEGYMLVPD
ncbi:response regulator [Alphaproteobacteria bacterium]|nr:response regulator [Alphaproteobacteria bacterium]